MPKNTTVLRMLLIGCVVVLIVVPVVLWAYETAAEWNWLRVHPVPGRMIDIGGYRLHLFRVGVEAPTVVLEAGVGDFSLVWDDVQRKLGKSVRTCSYDRGGLGWSDPSPYPRDPHNEAVELHRLLTEANVPGPYVLVGHSYGGDLVHVYAGKFPDKVAGVVLIEASNEDKWWRVPGMLQTWQGFNKDCRKDIWRARFGLLRLKHDPLPLYYPEAVRSVAEALTYMTKGIIANCREYASLIGVGAVEVGSVRTLGDIPLTIISAGKNIFEGAPGIPEREAGDIWKQLQSESLDLSSNSHQVIAQQSEHYVQHDQPKVVVQQILELVSKTRDLTHTPRPIN